MTTADCILKSLKDGQGWCKACDPHKRRLLPNASIRRNCRKRPCSGGRPTTVRQAAPSTYITLGQLAKDTKRLVGILPPDLTAVAGIPRSGLLPASQLACHLHLPLYSIGDEGLIPVGHGWRLRAPQRTDKILVVDDTLCRGKALCGALSRLKGQPCDTAVIYAKPETVHMVDYCACQLPGPHYLEWNFFNSVHLETSGFDFDGILCEDIDPVDDDDGPKYRKALENAVPKHLPRRQEIPLIVTARLEKYRELTLAWLRRHGVRVHRLLMGPWRNNRERAEPGAVVRFKAEQYRRSGCRLFVESDVRQAPGIAEISGKRVLCPEAGRVF